MFDVAILGAGRMGQIHARNAAAQPPLRLRYVVDQASGSAARLAADCGAEAADVETVLADASIRGVIVATSTDTHLQFTLACVAAGKAVFCEKPLDLDLGKCIAAEDRLTAPDARLFIAFNRRFDPHFAALKARLDGGAVGRLESLNIVNHDPASPPAHFIPTSGGLFKDFTIHDFDMARWLLGEEPVELFSTASCLVDEEIGRLGDVDTARTVLKTAGGRLCMISNTRRSGCGYDQRVEAFGSDGMAAVGNPPHDEVQVWRGDGATGSANEPSFAARYRASYAAEMAHFADVITGSARPAAGYRDSIEALRLAEAAAESARTGRAIQL